MLLFGGSGAYSVLDSSPWVRRTLDFLMEVARTEEDDELKQRAIFWLGQSNDPRVPDFLLSLIRGESVRR